MWPTMFNYITVQILRTFHFSFPLSKHSPPSYGFNFYFISCLLRMKDGCGCGLVENIWSTFSHFHKKNVNLSINPTIQHYRLLRLLSDNTKCYFVSIKPLSPIHLLFLQTKMKGKSFREAIHFSLKKSNKGVMRNPPKEHPVFI